MNSMLTKLVIIIGSIGAASSAIFVRASTTTSAVLALYRMIISTLILTPMALTAHRNEVRGLKKDEILLSVIGGFAFGIQVILYFESVKLTSVASAAILTETEVFFVVLFEVLWQKQKLPRWQVISILIAFVGIVIIALGDSGQNSFKGDLVALGCAVCCACYTLIGKRCRQNMSTTVFTWIAYFFAGVAMLIVALVQRTQIVGLGMVNILLAVGMTICVSLLGHSLFNWGLKYERASFVSTIKMMGPVFAAILAFLFMGEIPSIQTVIGGIVITAGVAISMRFDEAKKTGNTPAKENPA